MAQTDTPEYRFILAGDQRAGATYTVACPYDGAPVGVVHRAGPGELEQAIQSAVAAFEVTRKLPGHRRAAVLRKVSELIAARAEALARMIALEAGRPAAGLSVLPMNSKDATALVEDDRFKLLTFTGSPVVGWDMKRRAGRKRVTLELGGNAGCIVHSDADLAFAAERVAVG